MMQSVSTTASDEVKKELAKEMLRQQILKIHAENLKIHAENQTIMETIEKGQQLWTSPIEMVTIGEGLSPTSLNRLH